MPKSVEGAFHGRIELASRGIDEHQAADLRARLGAFREDWERPEMDVYDDIDRDDRAPLLNVLS